MIAPAPVLTTVALTAVIAALWALRGRSGAAVVAELAALYRLVAALLVCRLLALQDWPAITPLIIAVTMVIAAWLPLAGLRLVEELCRRHAPRVVKLAALGGAFALSVVAVTIGLVWTKTAIGALAAFQALSVAAMAIMLLANRRSLPRAERATADTFLIALVATIPLAMTDFVALFPDIPLRGGSFAVLLMVLATSRVTEGDGAPRRLLADIALCVGGGCIVMLATGGGVASAGLGFALAALALLVERFARSRARGESLISAIAASGAGVDALLSSHPLLAGGRVIEGEALSHYPAASISALARHPVISEATADPDARDAARDLLMAHGASHLVRLGPSRFLAVAAGSFTGARIDDELRIVARLIGSGA